MKLDAINTYPLPLNGLRQFYWAAKYESFKQAALTLNISEAAISQQIRNLESTLKVKLFDRGHQKVILTRKGRQLFPFVQSAFLNFQEGLNTITNDPEPNRLRVSTIPSIASNWLIKRLVNFNQLHPELSINIDTSLDLIDFETDNIELAIRYGSGNYPELKAEFLMQDPTVLVCAPSLVSNGVINRDDIVSTPSIVGTTSGVKQSMNDFKKFYGIGDNSQHQTLLLKDGALGVEAARSGQGITLQRMSLVVDLIQSGELVYAKEFASTAFNIYAVAPVNHFENPKVIKFLTWLKAEMTITANQIAPYLAKIKNLQ
ncbi:MAG: LysR family glycine cleavage system transcriptional activator [Enterobacterales bacterium]|jgi:LysR family glycine cleavage system transcriptional activator